MHVHVRSLFSLLFIYYTTIYTHVTKSFTVIVKNRENVEKSDVTAGRHQTH